MKNWKSSLISPSTPIMETIKAIDKGSLQIALVVDNQMKLLGTVTDGDIRRAILKKILLETPVEKIMFKEPTTMGKNASREEIIETMQRKELRQIPLVDERDRVVDLKILVEMIQEQRRSNWVVLMAGGIGARLKPLTEDCPKPLLKVGGKPVLETIIDNFREQGFFNFIISVNYKARMFKKYFGDGSKFGVHIEYIIEDKKLGTAGSLSLINKPMNLTFIVMNGDLLTKVNFIHLIDFHLQSKSIATMCVRDYNFQVPYGVVNIESHKLISIEEKPVHSFFVNAGIYVLEPDTLDLIPKNQYFDMTTLFEKLLDRGKNPTIFPIHEFWLDIGRQGDYELANGKYCQFFK
jgi:dTDP-glucose pyrophosphorylase